jgi:hypothetical protein
MMRTSLLIVLVAAAILAGSTTAWAEGAGEVIEPGPEDTPPETPVPAPTPPKSVEKLPLVIDEPGFKATAVFPEQPVPKFDQDTRPAEAIKPQPKKLQFAKEEGVDDDETPDPAIDPAAAK